MRSAKNTVVCAVILFSALILTAIKGYAAPAETNHWNSNTFGNLNTLADKTTVTFSIGYNETGTIEWFKDGILSDTLSNATSAQFTTSWSETGMKEVKARMTNGSGMSAVTVWPVEVQEMGTAVIEECTTYPQYTLAGYLTLNCMNGWVNFPTMYLKTKKPDDWIEYVSAGRYNVKANIAINSNAILRADDGSARVVKMRCLPLGNSDVGLIVAANGGSIYIDSMTIMGYDYNSNQEITIDLTSPKLQIYGGSVLRITNSDLRHIFINCNDTDGIYIASNTFTGANPFCVWLEDNCSSATVINNTFDSASRNMLWAKAPYSLIGYNRFLSSPGGSGVIVCPQVRFIGNEVVYAGWNSVEFGGPVLSRDNNIHDNGGNHNGFNGMSNGFYSVNDYWHDITPYAGLYCQLNADPPYPVTPDRWQEHVYVFNGKAKDIPCGLQFCGCRDVYLYNVTLERSIMKFEFGIQDFFVRKCRFDDERTDGGYYEFEVDDVLPELYGYCRNITMLDTEFNVAAATDIGLYVSSSAVINVINSYHKNSSSITAPSAAIDWHYIDTASCEVRFYAWLDAIVKDINGNPVQDARVTVENLSVDTSIMTLKVTLPPPPPDLWEIPAQLLPQPSIQPLAQLTTLSNGKIPGPNYGWSENPESSAAILFKKLYVKNANQAWASGYQYRITAKYHGLEASMTVTPDETWLREDPTVPSNTVELVLNGDATAGIDTTPPTLMITSPENNKPVYDAMAITAAASDNWDIEKLEIFIDNVSRAVISADSCTWTADSYICSWNWDTAQESDGVHNIKVIAHDISGNMTERTITVEVLAQASRTNDNAIIYPNPYIKGKSRGSSCTFANLAPDATVRVYTVSGDLVTTLSAETRGDKASTEWDVSKVGGGVYLYSIHSSRGAQKGKIGIVK